MSKRNAVIVMPTGDEVPVRPEVAPAPPLALDTQAVAVFERLALDPNVDPAKMRELVELQKDILAVRAKQAFERAYSDMQDELPIILKKGKITDKHGALRSKYARFGEDILVVIKPVLRKHGFTLRHRTEFPAGKVKTIGVLTHVMGHQEVSEFEAAPDKSEFRSAVQDHGSTSSYGKRYTTCDLLCLTLVGEDKDGTTDGVAPEPEAPRSNRRAGRPHEAPRTPVEPEPPAGQHPHSGQPITDSQRNRMWTIAKGADRSKAEVSEWLRRRFGWKSSHEITRDAYDFVCNCLTAPGPLQG